jgi:copper resistance protein B
MRPKWWVAFVGVGVFAFGGMPVSLAQTMSDDPAMHEPLVGHLLVDQLEYRRTEGDGVIAWDAQAWYGGDYDKLWIKTAGEWTESSFERAELQLLYSRLVGYYWDVQAGLRHDFEPDPSRFYAVLGLQGLAPGYFELDLQAFVSEEGDISARLEAEYDILITQRLVLQPKAELNVAIQDVEELGVGSGVSDLEVGVRLRYEFVRELAPYVGVSWERKFGDTADFARQEDEDVESLSVLAGVRFWF